MACEEFQRRYPSGELSEFERVYLSKELTEHGWNRKSTARDLGLRFSILVKKIESLGLRPPQKSEEGTA